MPPLGDTAQSSQNGGQVLGSSTELLPELRCDLLHSRIDRTAVPGGVGSDFKPGDPALVMSRGAMT